MKIELFCRKHYRRAVPYVPMLVPTRSIERMGCIVNYRKDLEYQMKCPVCWDNGDREATFRAFEENQS